MCKEGFEKDPLWKCKPCDKGTYADKPDAESCTPCPEGQTTLYKEAQSADQCQGEKTTFLEIRRTFCNLRQIINETLFVNQICPVHQAKDITGPKGVCHAGSVS